MDSQCISFICGYRVFLSMQPVEFKTYMKCHPYYNNNPSSLQYCRSVVVIFFQNDLATLSLFFHTNFETTLKARKNQYLSDSQICITKMVTITWGWIMELKYNPYTQDHGMPYFCICPCWGYSFDWHSAPQYHYLVFILNVSHEQRQMGPNMCQKKIYKSVHSPFSTLMIISAAFLFPLLKYLQVLIFLQL